MSSKRPRRGGGYGYTEHCIRLYSFMKFFCLCGMSGEGREKDIFGLSFFRGIKVEIVCLKKGSLFYMMKFMASEVSLL